MRSPVVAVLALVGMALADTSVMAQRGRRFGGRGFAGNGWQFSLEAGKQEARKAGKPLMVVLRCQP